MSFIETLVTIFICVVLPIAIVWIISSTKKHELNRKTEVMIKAIENGQQIDPEMFKQVKEARSTKQMLHQKLNGGLVCFFIGLAILVTRLFQVGRSVGDWLAGGSLLGGGILIAVGLALIISYFVGKKMFAEEIRKQDNL